MSYIELMNKLKELGLDPNTISLSSPTTLASLIDAYLPQYFELFTPSAFTQDNIRLIIEKSSKEEDVSVLKKIRMSDPHFGTEILEALLTKKYFTTANIFMEEIVANPPMFSIYLNHLADYNISIDSLKRLASRLPTKTIDIITSLISANRLDLVALLISSTNNIRLDLTDVPSIIKDHINEIVAIMNFFHLSPEPSQFQKNFELFDVLFLNGHSASIDAIKYMGSDKLTEHIISSPEIVEKILYYASLPEQNNILTEAIKRLPTILANPRYLKALITKQDFTNIVFCSDAAWTIENQLYFLQKTAGITIPNTNFYRHAPLLTYYEEYKYSKPYLSPRSYTDYQSVTNIADINKCIAINNDITSGKIEETTPLTKLYQLLASLGSKNICSLTYALLEGNLSNLPKLITMDGLTPFYQSFLSYDFDYINSNIDKVGEANHHPNYQTYISLLKLSPDMGKYLKPLKLNPYNIDEYFENNTLTRKAIDALLNSEGIKSIAILVANNYPLALSDIERQIIIKHNTITSPNQQDSFLNYCLAHRSDITSDQIDSIYELIIKINNSNSYELRKQADKIVSRLINLPNYQEAFAEIEYILTEGRTPEFIKRFAIYKILYGNKEIANDTGVTSSILKSVSPEEADQIILRDLLKISLATGSNDIKQYLNIITTGERLYQSIDKEQYLTGQLILNEESAKLLHEYRHRLEFIFDYLLKITYTKTDDDYTTLYNMEHALQQSLDLTFPFDFHIPATYDFILSKIAPSFKSVINLQMYIGKYEILKTALEESKKIKNKPLEIKQGDFIKGINSAYLDNILNYGSLSIEFLGENSNEDITHLDTDMSLIPSDMPDIPTLLRQPLTGCSWGDMNLILSRSYMDTFNDYVITADETGPKPYTEEDKNKTEVFSYNKDKTHYCIRTGFPLTYVKAIVTDGRNIDRTRFLVSKCPFYIPIYDKEGHELYPYDEYYKDQKNLAGLSYYGNTSYQLSPNLLTPEIESIIPSIQGDRLDTHNKRQAIYNALDSVLKEYFTEIKHQLNSSVKKGSIEIIDTGSTGRNTNVAGDGDFDFIVRVDHEFIESPRFKEFSAKIYQLFGLAPGDSKRIRLKDVHLPNIADPLQVELTFIDKNSKIDYSTDMCIIDRLTTIEQLHPDAYPLVKANIIYAKKFFKAIGAYKTYDGGLGGVGVETWILQNGGSFADAVASFVATANIYPNLTKFKKHYHIHDYGKNHFAYAENNYKQVSFPYDDYVNFLNNQSFTKIVAAFKIYLDKQLVPEHQPQIA